MEIYTTSDQSGFFNCLAAAFRVANKWHQLEASLDSEVNTLQNRLPYAPELYPLVESKRYFTFAAKQYFEAAEQVGLELLDRYCREAGCRETDLAGQLKFLRSQMVAGGYYVAGSTRSVSVQTVTCVRRSRVGITEWNDQGLPTFLYSETLSVIVDDSGVIVTGEAAVERHEAAWPRGSDVSLRLAPLESLLSNGDFTTVVNDRPDGWIIGSGTWGTDLGLTAVEQQQLTISGATGGGFALVWTDQDNKRWSTGLIAYPTSAAAIQTALRAIPGLEQVVVEGTNPYTITLYGVINNPGPLEYVNNLIGTNPQISITTIQNGDGAAWRGPTLWFSSTATPEINQPVHLERERVYAVGLVARRTLSASGTLRLALKRGVGGSFCLAPDGNLCTADIAVSSLPTTNYQPIVRFFRLAASEPRQVVLCVTLLNGTAAERVYVDDIVLAPAVPIFTGGPYLAVFDGPFAGVDEYRITCQDNRGGAWQAAFDRYFRAAERGAPLPTSGSILIPDSLLTG